MPAQPSSATAPTVAGPADAGARASRFHPEIQALRALAVALVVVYHVQPTLIPNGFVGVDVFFVISGYLITGHLARGLLANGRLHLGQFYARRVRRLLPAAFVVLLAVAGGTWLFAPRTEWVEFARQLIASTFYVENWALAANAVDYSAPAGDVSPVQHFWSLSVEEQFYLVWPILLLLAVLIVRSAPALRRRALVIVCAVVAVVSFIVSVLWTRTDASSAYFVTPTRMWEFAVGGLLAIALPAVTGRSVLRAVLSWAGLALILLAAFRFSDANAFPGWIAVIPVAGTLAVIAAGTDESRWSTRWLLQSRPVQYLGDISYSLYLWHWPVVVLLPAALGTKLTLPVKVTAVVLSVALAAASKRWIEDRFRADQRRSVKSPRRATAAWRTLVAGFVGMAVVGAAAVPLATTAAAETAQAQAQLAAVLAARPSGFGAASSPSASSDSVSIVPAPIIARDDFYRPSGDRVCQQTGAFTGATSCTFGSDAAGAIQVALVGDSHAAQWLPTVVALADRYGWHVTTYLRSGCPLSESVPKGTLVQMQACTAWTSAVFAQIAAHRFDTVLLSALDQTAFTDGSASTGAAGAISTILGHAAHVVVIRDDPTPQVAGQSDVPTCVQRNQDHPAVCDVARSSALLPDPQAEAAGAAGADVLDLTNRFCDSTTCPAVIGGVLVYRDGHHITATFARTLVPAFTERLRALQPHLLSNR